MEKICPECDKLFVPGRRGKPQIYCSRKCFSKAYERHPDDTKDTPKDAICGLEDCKKPFVKIKRNQRYCSRECYKRAWRTNNREAFNTRAVAYRNRNIEKSRAYERKLYSKNRPKLLTSRPWAYLLTSRRNEARKRNIPFDLTHEWACARWTGRCEITGIEFRLNGKNGPHPFSPSLDKIDPKRGYAQDNCRFILWGCNAIKGVGTDEDMYFIACAIANHHRP